MNTTADVNNDRRVTGMLVANQFQVLVMSIMMVIAM